MAKLSHNGSTKSSQDTRALFYLSDEPDKTPTDRLNYTLFPIMRNEGEDLTVRNLDVGPLSNCPITSQIRIRILREDGEENESVPALV